MRRIITLLFLLLLATVSATFAEDLRIVDVKKPDVPGFIGYVRDEIVVKVDESVLKRMQRDRLTRGQTGIFALDQQGLRFDAVSIRPLFPGAKRRFYRGRPVDLAGWHNIRFRGGIDVGEVVREYKRIQGVVDAQPIGVHGVYAMPNDTYFGNQWHLNQATDADVDAPEAWDLETGRPEVVVAILDTGVRWYHKDLGGSTVGAYNLTTAGGNLWVNSVERQSGINGVDDDGNGYVDDIVGWDFVASVGYPPVWSGEDGMTADNDPRDFNGHGTHCAGIVAAITNNGYGVAGIAGGWGDGTRQPGADGVRVMACRIGYSAAYLGSEAGVVRMDYAAQALRYAADNGARIASCSWGSSNTGGIGDAIDYFLQKGGLIFKAAGNSNNQTTDYMTARDDIISVAATDAADGKADFSSYGSWVDISAPGVDILSLWENHEDPYRDYIASMSGTSMATPLAAGVTALIWSQHPSWSAAEVKQALYASADPIDNLNPGYGGLLGAGRVNAFRAVSLGAGVPEADFSASPTAGCAPLTVSFTDQSRGDAIASWSWDFGDGGTSDKQNPSHDYNAAGVYPVTLTVTNPGGSDTLTKDNYITVRSAPGADFTASPLSGPAPLAVTFTDASSGYPTSWFWNFGDGGTASQQNPVHTYTNPGTYTVTLTATNDCGSDQATQTGYISVTEPPANRLHLAAVAVDRQTSFFGLIARGRVRVKLVDAAGSPVAAATVTGRWSGSATDSDTFTTGADGWGTAYSNWVWGGSTFTFCVSQVTKSGWTYDPPANPCGGI